MGRMQSLLGCSGLYCHGHNTTGTWSLLALTVLHSHLKITRAEIIQLQTLLVHNIVASIVGSHCKHCCKHPTRGGMHTDLAAQKPHIDLYLLRTWVALRIVCEVSVLWTSACHLRAWYALEKFGSLLVCAPSHTVVCLEYLLRQALPVDHPGRHCKQPAEHSSSNWASTTQQVSVTSLSENGAHYVWPSCMSLCLSHRSLCTSLSLCSDCLSMTVSCCDCASILYWNEISQTLIHRKECTNALGFVTRSLTWFPAHSRRTQPGFDPWRVQQSVFLLWA